MAYTTYQLRSGDRVTSKDGAWPTQYTNRTQAQRAAAKILGAEVIQRGRPFYVRLPDAPDAVACDKCKTLVAPEAGEVVEVFVSRQTHWEPAEYESQFWCDTCRSRAEAEAEGRLA